LGENERDGKPLICEENQMKNLSSLLGAVSVLALCAVAQAQDPAMAPAPPDAAPTAGVTVTTSTTTGGADDTIVGSTAAPDTMPTTGGAPMAMVLAGSMVAAGAFLARRKLSGSNA